MHSENTTFMPRAGTEPLYTVEGDYSVKAYSIIVLGRPYPENNNENNDK